MMPEDAAPAPIVDKATSRVQPLLAFLPFDSFYSLVHGNDDETIHEHKVHLDDDVRECLG